MEGNIKLGNPPLPPDTYPKQLTLLDEAGDYVRNLKEDKTRILSRVQSDDENMKLQLGVMCLLLSDKTQNKFEFKDLILISRDNLKNCTSHILTIINDYWLKLNLNVRLNILNLLIDFLSFPSSEALFSAVFKRLITGDISQSNLSLVENMLVLIEEHKEILLKERKFIPLIVYTYLRLIPTHYQFSIGVNTPNNNIARLCRKEIALVLDIMKNNFDDCFRFGGRDIMFVIQQVSNIPEFQAFWIEVNNNLGSISNYFKDVSEIFAIGTPKNIIQTSIPFEMENWILWMMRNVHHCSSNPYKRYQDLFTKRFFATHESQNLRPFLIRFIIRVFYPDNEMIGSTLLSRWATISWLIVQASSQFVLSMSKLALIYDWLFYDGKYDCIMDIEPAILAIMHNLNKYANVSITLVDFIIKTIHNLIPSIKEKIMMRFRVGLNEAIRVNVFRSLIPLLEVLKHQPDLYKQFVELVNDPNLIPTNHLVTTTAPPINNSNVAITSSVASVPSTIAANLSKTADGEKNGIPKQLSPSKDKILEHVNKSVVNRTMNNLTNSTVLNDQVKAGSVEFLSDQKVDEKDEEMYFEDLQRKFMKYSLAYDYDVERIDVLETINQISSNVTVALENLYNTAQQCPFANKGRQKKEKRLSKKIPKKIDLNDDNDLSGSDEECVQDLCEKMEKVVIAILGDDDNFDDLGTAGKTAAVICEICYPYFEKKLFPGNADDEEKLKASLSHPIFVLLKNICSMSATDNKREVLLLLLSEMQMRQPRVGYYLLYYLKVAKVNDSDLSIYRSLCNSLEKPNLKNSLYKDLELLSNDDSKLMVFLLPDLYRAFAAEMVNNPKFAHLIISTIDATEMYQLVLEIHKNNLFMFDQSTIVDLLNASLDWGTIEQFFIWELVIAHNFPVKFFYGLIPYLDYRKNPEAMTRFSNLLKQEKFSTELGKLLLNREVKDGDHFTSTLLQFWICKNKVKFAEVLHLILSNSLGHNQRDRKKKHTLTTDDNAVDLIRVLEQLDFIRKYCEDISFLVEESIQMDLKQVLNSRSLCDEVKSRFTELLAFVEEDTDELQIDESVITSGSGTNSSKGRVLRHLDSRKANVGSNVSGNATNSSSVSVGSVSTSSSIAVAGSKRNYVESSSSEDDDSDTERKPSSFHCRPKKRMTIAD